PCNLRSPGQSRILFGGRREKYFLRPPPPRSARPSRVLLSVPGRWNKSSRRECRNPAALAATRRTASAEFFCKTVSSWSFFVRLFLPPCRSIRGCGKLDQNFTPNPPNCNKKSAPDVSGAPGTPASEGGRYKSFIRTWGQRVR